MEITPPSIIMPETISTQLDDDLDSQHRPLLLSTASRNETRTILGPQKPDHQEPRVVSFAADSASADGAGLDAQRAYHQHHNQLLQQGGQQQQRFGTDEYQQQRRCRGVLLGNTHLSNSTLEPSAGDTKKSPRRTQLNHSCQQPPSPRKQQLHYYGQDPGFYHQQQKSYYSPLSSRCADSLPTQPPPQNNLLISPRQHVATMTQQQPPPPFTACGSLPLVGPPPVSTLPPSSHYYINASFPLPLSSQPSITTTNSFPAPYYQEYGQYPGWSENSNTMGSIPLHTGYQCPTRYPLLPSRYHQHQAGLYDSQPFYYADNYQHPTSFSGPSRPRPYWATQDHYLYRVPPSVDDEKIDPGLSLWNASGVSLEHQTGPNSSWETCSADITTWAEPPAPPSGVYTAAATSASDPYNLNGCTLIPLSKDGRNISSPQYRCSVENNGRLKTRVTAPGNYRHFEQSIESPIVIEGIGNEGKPLWRLTSTDWGQAKPSSDKKTNGGCCLW